MYPTDTEQILKAYEEAKRVYRGFGVDTDEALRQFREIPISLHCWQGDDVQGFEQLGDVASQNLVTGSYGGAARNARGAAAGYRHGVQPVALPPSRQSAQHVCGAQNADPAQ